MKKQYETPELNIEIFTIPDYLCVDIDGNSLEDVTGAGWEEGDEGWE